jgi:hypothetical protein
MDFDKDQAECIQGETVGKTILANFTSREGWVVGHAATGSDAWNESSDWTGRSF